MFRKTPAERHVACVKRVASALFQCANRAVPGWNEMYYDARYFGFFGFERVIIRRGNERVHVYSPNKMTKDRDHLLLLRRDLPDNYWHGLFIHLDCDGNVDVEYDYDPECIGTFDEDETAHWPF